MTALADVRRPTGRIPLNVQWWLEANGMDHWFLVVCDKCGKWVDEIDRLAPYRIEMNRCYRCEPRKKKQSS